ncbi:hypothetical protein [Tateyamaria sp. ANG-S1]|uniref:hypothetical protein n=1 Tax=Tateyamaria sp. ANG-S1 TaxID=1577905 RepID=UPI00057CC6D1|nr:hypothetical protein [Tateyamaria sp. ANG-S1]
MTLDEMKKHLAAHGAEDGVVYSHGGLGGGEIDGIEEIDGIWYTYFSERGSKRGYKAWPSEEEAVEYIARRAQVIAKQFGVWRE